MVGNAKRTPSFFPTLYEQKRDRRQKIFVKKNIKLKICPLFVKIMGNILRIVPWENHF